MILYSYIFNQEPLPEDLFQDLLRQVPESIQQKVNKYKRWEDRYNCLFGKLLLGSMLEYFGYHHASLGKLFQNEFGKLYIDQRIDFNISHSGNLVGCVVSDMYQVGIDVEKKIACQPASISCFLRPEELQYLNMVDTPEVFFDFWTKKESLLKAKGVGLNIDLKRVFIEGERGILQLINRKEIWHYYKLGVGQDYVANLCTEKEDLNIQFVPSYDLLKAYQK